MRLIRIHLPLIGALYVGAATVAVYAFGVSLPLLALPGIVLAWLATDAIARPGSSLLYPTVTHGPRRGNRVALSFDDGPDPHITPQVLDALAQHGARATFFAIGRSLAAHPEIARRIVADGHALANHSWQHSRWQAFYGFRKSLREIQRGAQGVLAVTAAPRPPLYRPPVGLKTPALARAAHRCGLTVIAWSLHSHDSRTNDPQRIAQRVLQKVRAGDIVLMHDGHDRPGRHRVACVESLTLILQGLHEKGLECVTVPELL